MLITVSAKDASSCSHQDVSRKTVGTTAHGTAYLRALESSKSNNALFIDPFGEVLAGDVGKYWINTLLISGPAIPGQTYKPDSEMVHKFAVRTRAFDDFVKKCVIEDGFTQVCVIGAGLDTRPWRLFNANPPSLDWFEVDFPEIFAYKLPVISEAGGETKCGKYHSIAADLSLHTWMEKLLSSGFCTDKKAAWIMEGLTGYLSEEELSILVANITYKLSATGSKLMASFVGTSSDLKAINLHRFQTNSGLEFMMKFGWEGTQEDLIDILPKYNKGSKPNDGAANILNIQRGGLYICDLKL